MRLQKLLGSSLGKMDGAPPERCSLDRRRQRDAELFCQARTAAAAVILYGWGWSPCSPPPDWSVWPTWKHAAARKARKLVKTASWWGWRITATTCSRHMRRHPRSVCGAATAAKQATVGIKSRNCFLKNSSVYTSYVRQTISRGVRAIEVPQAKFRPPRPTHTRTPDRNPPNGPANSGARAVAGACLGHLPSDVQTRNGLKIEPRRCPGRRLAGPFGRLRSGVLCAQDRTSDLDSLHLPLEAAARPIFGPPLG